MSTLRNIFFANPPKNFGGGGGTTSYLANNQYFKPDFPTIPQSPAVFAVSAVDAVFATFRCETGGLCVAVNPQFSNHKINKVSISVRRKNLR